MKDWIIFDLPDSRLLNAEAIAQRYSVKKAFLEISQNSQENTCARVPKRDTAKVISREFCEIFKNTFFTEHL